VEFGGILSRLGVIMVMMPGPTGARFSFAKLDFVKHRAKTHGRRAAAALTRNMVMEWIGRQYFRFQYPTVEWGQNIQIAGKVTIRGTGRVIIGDDCVFDAASGRPNTIAVLSPDATVVVGAGSYLNGATILATESISVGAGSVLGQCTIVDSDFHPVDPTARGAGERGAVSPVVIGQRVWIGTDVLVLKGATVGSEAVVGAGSVVRHTVPERTVVTGERQRPLSEVADPAEVLTPAPR
jgi:carbonic anhydrase/acetyltransferase-like protein (isoleucine patch superfamily)